MKGLTLSVCCELHYIVPFCLFHEYSVKLKMKVLDTLAVNLMTLNDKVILILGFVYAVMFIIQVLCKLSDT